MRYGPNRISICSVTALNSIYGFKANSRKSDWYQALSTSFDVDNIFTLTDRETHAARKRILSQVLSPDAVRRTQDYVLNDIRLLCNNLAQNDEPWEWSRPKNMSEWINFTVSDTISDLCFGCNLNLLGSGEYRDILQAFVAGMRALHIVIAPLQGFKESAPC